MTLSNCFDLFQILLGLWKSDGVSVNKNCFDILVCKNNIQNQIHESYKMIGPDPLKPPELQCHRLYEVCVSISKAIK